MFVRNGIMRDRDRESGLPGPELILIAHRSIRVKRPLSISNNHLELNTWARKNVKLFVLCLDKLSAEMTIIVRNNTPGSDLCKSCRSNIPLGAEATSNSPLYTNRKYLYYKSLNTLQDRLATLPSRPSASEFQHPPYFPPPFAASGPASAASADVFTPVSLQHLQTADPYHVTTSLQNFSPPQVIMIPLSFSSLPALYQSDALEANSCPCHIFPCE